jgi:hypothetical protein
MAGYQHTNSKGITYYLHKQDVQLRGGKTQTIYFFAKKANNEKGTGKPTQRFPRCKEKITSFFTCSHAHLCDMLRANKQGVKRSPSHKSSGFLMETLF